MKVFPISFSNFFSKSLAKRLTVAIFFSVTFVVFFSQCGLFYKGVPKAGEFCYVLTKPPECLYVDFESKKLTWNDVEYTLKKNFVWIIFLNPTENCMNSQFPLSIEWN